MTNPFSNPEHEIDYNLKGKDVNLNPQKKSAPKQIAKPTLDSIFGIDLVSALHGTKDTQKNWISYFNKEKKQMIGAGHLYSLAKAASLGSKIAEDFLKILQTEFKNSWLVCGDHIRYNDNSMKAEIVHDYQSTIVNPRATLLDVPHIHYVNLFDIFRETHKAAYAKEIFEAQGDSNILFAETLQILSGKSVEDIVFVSASMGAARKINPEQAFGFGYNGSRFHIGSRDWVDGFDGISRGVLLK